MKKIIFLLLVVFVANTQMAQAQSITGFKKNGPVETTSQKIGVTISYGKHDYPNGGKEIIVTYQKFETTSSYQPKTPYIIDTIKVENTTFHRTVIGPTLDGSQQIAGANELTATENEVIVTRYLPKDSDPKTALVTKYTFSKEKCIRELIYGNGEKEWSQVLP